MSSSQLALDLIQHNRQSCGDTVIRLLVGIFFHIHTKQTYNRRMNTRIPLVFRHHIAIVMQKYTDESQISLLDGPVTTNVNNTTNIRVQPNTDLIIN